MNRIMFIKSMKVFWVASVIPYTSGRANAKSREHRNLKFLLDGICGYFGIQCPLVNIFYGSCFYYHHGNVFVR